MGRQHILGEAKDHLLGYVRNYKSIRKRWSNRRKEESQAILKGRNQKVNRNMKRIPITSRETQVYNFIQSDWQKLGLMTISAAKDEKHAQRLLWEY